MFCSTTVFTASYNFFCFCFYTHAGSSGGPTLARGSWRDFSVKTNFNYCDSNTCSTWGMFQKWDISAAGSVARVHPEPIAAIFVLFSLSWENRVLWDWYLTHCGGAEKTITPIKFNLKNFVYSFLCCLSISFKLIPVLAAIHFPRHAMTEVSMSLLATITDSLSSLHCIIITALSSSSCTNLTQSNVSWTINYNTCMH